jgi:cell division septum initiation protein DivIVA
MAKKNGFFNWVGYKEESEPSLSSVDRIRELESQLTDLRSRRDIRSLSREEFEILATETAVAMIKSAQIRESKAQAASDRLVNETQRQAKEAIESAQDKAQSILNGAEARGRKYLKAAEDEATEKLEQAELAADELLDQRKREGSALLSAARREGEQIVGGATKEVLEYRQWLNGVMEEAGRLYRIQTQSLDAAEEAIHASRSRLESAYSRLSELRNNVLENIKEDGKLVSSEPIRVKSERTKSAISAPAKKKSAAKPRAKKSAKKK